MSGVDTGSFFPTTSEVVRAVQFVRENPAVALGVVVGIASLSVAKYYEDEEEVYCDGDATEIECPAEEIALVSGIHTAHPHVTKPKSASDETMSLTDSLAAMEISTPAPSRSNSLMKSSKTRSSLVDCSDVTVQDESTPAMPRSCSFCNNHEENTPGECCDPDWGWFIPTGPDDHDSHHQQHHTRPQAPAHVV